MGGLTVRETGATVMALEQAVRADVCPGMGDGPDKTSNTVATVVFSVFVLLVVLALILPRASGKERGGPSEVHSDLASLGRLIETFKTDTGRYPSDAEGLEALRARPDGAGGWRGPYLTRPAPVDPWDRPYFYRTTTTPGGPSFVLLSYGADGTEGGTGEDADVVESGPESVDSH